MIALAYTATTIGVTGHVVRIEADSSPGTPTFTMIGLPDRAWGESRERVRAAIINSGFHFPAGRLLVNLAPADLRKTGMGFDLPLALVLLAIDEHFPRARLAEWLAVGELTLDGGIRPVSGVLPMILGARSAGISRILVHKDNAAEAALVEHVEIYAVTHLGEAVSVLLGHGHTHRYIANSLQRKQSYKALGDFAQVRGQVLAKRALEISAAGGHHVRMIGPPGCGKTMLASRFPSILPPMSEAEALASAAIRSAAGIFHAQAGLSFQRPFQAPHHTITQAALIGGGRLPKPGEVSLAHHGVLFLDELLEFSRATLEVLRQPLEDGKILIARSAGTVEYPARFMLIVAMNPCPCGMRGEPLADCRCDGPSITRYSARLSGPLLDRLDLSVRVNRIAMDELSGRPLGEASAVIRARVEAARTCQSERYQSTVALNAAAGGDFLRSDEQMEPSALQLLRMMAEQKRISARAFDRVLRVARTIADLQQQPRIQADSIAEAFSYR